MTVNDSERILKVAKTLSKFLISE